MKLIDMLVEDGMNGWQWPAGVKCITQDYGSGPVYRGVVFGYREEPYLKKNVWLANNRLGHADVTIKRYDSVADDWATAIITREQYEAALAAKNDGWIEWGGGKCPVEEGTLVDVRYRDSEYYHDLLGVYALSSFGVGADYWVRNGLSNDIVAYRLHKPTTSEQVRAAAWNAYAGITEADDEADLNDCIEKDALPVWNGEGLPPVGCFCEVEDVDGMLVYGQGESGEVITHVENTAVIRMSYGLGCFEAGFLRPIRTEAERKRDEVRKAMYAAMDIVDGDIADAIYDAIAAGKIPGVKLED